ncbi:MAG: hypothetical protein IJN54_12070 [Lachnospiraceae bacterium]|nr:hypothetical protein [Lachnospiraceae bacterium]
MTDEIIRFVFLLCILNIMFCRLSVYNTIAQSGIILKPEIYSFIERILYMKLPLFASFIVFCVWVSYQLKRQRTKEARLDDSYWAREAAANNTRKKPLDDVEYITIPFDFLPMHTLAEDNKVAECHQILLSLRDQKIVNLTGLTNTDLKLRYGVANLNFLADCDQRYTSLARTLQKWASLLYEAGYTDDAKTILEFAVSTKTDVSSTYALLSDIYKKEGQSDKIESLLQIAEGLNSAMKPTIVRILQESGPCND